MFPINVAILPVYLVLLELDKFGLNLVDSLSGVILVQIAFQLSGNIMILSNFFTSVPTEIQDSAYIDGCTNFDFFWRIMLPLVKPALAAVASLIIIKSWNDLLVPLVVLNSNELWTLPSGNDAVSRSMESGLGFDIRICAVIRYPNGDLLLLCRKADCIRYYRRFGQRIDACPRNY